MNNQEEQVSLYFREGSSDKVYRASLTHHPSGWSVTFAYGRRGNSLTTGTKTSGYVPYGSAKKVYDKLVSEKKNKGYVEDPAGKPVITTVSGQEDSGFRPQLLNPITEEEVEKYLVDDNWCAQEKFDGVNRLIIVDKGKISGTNRKGLFVGLDKEVITAAGMLPDGIYGGEAFDDRVVLFDLHGPDSYKFRYYVLFNRMSTVKGNVLKVPYTAWTQEEKRNLFAKLVNENAEGIVFKDIRAPYTAGRPASGGTQLKFKFWDSCSCIVTGVNNQRSISVGLKTTVKIEDSKIPVIQEVGNVTIPPNKNIPKKGDIVEIKYLYAYPGGSLYQPIYTGLREDIDPWDCVISQLKYKRNE